MMKRLLILLVLLPVVSAQGVGELAENLELGPIEETIVENPITGGDGKSEAPGQGIPARLEKELGSNLMIVGILGSAAPILGLVAFGLVTRYVSPKEALRNPQRAMIFGFLKATPGAHLKQLSDEFSMKTSSILWHIRKLEGAELVHSERANGFRVFYAVEGGVEAKRLSRAITALHNDNAVRIFGVIQRSPGITVKLLSERTEVPSGTVRWHLKKLRDYGLIEELIREDGSSFFPSKLGAKALECAEGRPTVGAPSPAFNAIKA